MSRQAQSPLPAEDTLESRAYRLKRWPEVPERFRTAPVLRALSRMSLGPVTGKWLLTHTGLDPLHAAELMASMRKQGCLEVIDLSPYLPRPAAAAAPPRKPAARNARWKPALVVALICLTLSASLGERQPERKPLQPAAAPKSGPSPG